MYFVLDIIGIVLVLRQTLCIHLRMPITNILTVTYSITRHFIGIELRYAEIVVIGDAVIDFFCYP